MSELRFYTFVNFYLSSIQQGVQSFHVCHEMFNKYPYNQDIELDDWCRPDSLAIEHRLHDWSSNHKTLIVLNGGANTDIENVYYTLDRLSKNLSFPMPFTKFNEDEKSLGGIITACGCVLPEEIYNAVDSRKAAPFFDALDSVLVDAYYYIEDDKVVKRYVPGSPEHELIALLKSCSLAR